MPTEQRTVQVAAPPSAVYDILADVSRTPEWLTRCTQIERLDPGPIAVGSPLRYHYRDGGRTGQMEGTVTVLEPGRHLAMHYSDKVTDVTVDFQMAPGARDASTELTHTIDIRLKGLGKMFGPVVSRQLPEQTREAMERLKALAESTAG